MKTFYVTSADGKTGLACYRSECKNPTALLQISHGMCEYFNRYAEFAAYMARRGVLVFGHDHLGHGASAASEADLGFTAEGGGADALVEDVHFLSLRMKMEYPNTPLVLFGHSMGSFIAREAVARHPEVYNAAIFCGTGGPDMPAKAGKLLARLLMLFQGERHRSPLLKSISFAGYNKKYNDVQTPVDWLTRDREIVEAYRSDPWCNYVFTLRAYHDLFTLVESVSAKGWASRLPEGIPYLVVSGEMDPVGGWGIGVKKVADRMRAAGLNTTLRLYPEMRHEILNELGREQVYEELELWMKTFLEERRGR